VNLVQVPFEAAADQLKAGQLDAVVSAIPFSVTVLENPKNKALFDVQDKALRDLDPSQDVMASVMFTSQRSWAADNPEAAAAYEKSLDEADQWINANKDEALKEMSDWLGIDLEVLKKMPWPIPVKADITQANLKPSVDLFVAIGALKKADAPDLSDRFPNE
jgi:ABC-type nitrate/sulfonate/bicarbonate transport system substrate-binding protein